jgi:hypothetical protein
VIGLDRACTLVNPLILWHVSFDTGRPPLLILQRSLPQLLESLIETTRRLFIQVDEAYGEPEFASLTQRFGFQRDHAHVRQRDFHHESDACRLRMRRIHEAAAEAQVKNAQGCFKGADSDAVKWTGDSIVASAIDSCLDGGLVGERPSGDVVNHPLNTLLIV